MKLALALSHSILAACLVPGAALEMPNSHLRNLEHKLVAACLFAALGGALVDRASKPLCTLIPLSVYLQANKQRNLETTHTVCAFGCDFTTIALALADVSIVNGSIIEVKPGTYAGVDGIVIEKSITIKGEDYMPKPILQGSGVAFYPRADDITIQGLLFQNYNSNGVIRFERQTTDSPEVPIKRTTLQHLVFDGVGRGIEVHNNNTAEGLLVHNCDFKMSGDNIGLRVASSGHIDGGMIIDSRFANAYIGIVTSNTFDSSWYDFVLYGFPGPVVDVEVTGNTLTGSKSGCFIIWSSTFQNVSMVGNTCETAEGAPRAIWIYGHDGAGFDTVTFRCNNLVGNPLLGVEFYPLIPPEIWLVDKVDVKNNYWEVDELTGLPSVTESEPELEDEVLDAEKCMCLACGAFDGSAKVTICHKPPKKDDVTISHAK